MLTTAYLARFKGGQLEIQSLSGEYLLRGEIGNVQVFDGEIDVDFVWLAKSKSGIPPTGWIKAEDDEMGYSISTDICSPSEMSDGRLAVMSAEAGELLVFFQPGASEFNRSKVEGL